MASCVPVLPTSPQSHLSEVLHLRPLTKDLRFCSKIFSRQGWGKVYEAYNFIFPPLFLSIFTFPDHHQPVTWTWEGGCRNKLPRASPLSGA